VNVAAVNGTAVVSTQEEGLEFSGKPHLRKRWWNSRLEMEWLVLVSSGATQRQAEGQTRQLTDLPFDMNAELPSRLGISRHDKAQQKLPRLFEHSNDAGKSGK